MYLYIEIFFSPDLKRCPSASSLPKAAGGGSWSPDGEDLPQPGEAPLTCLPQEQATCIVRRFLHAYIPILHSQQAESSAISRSLCAAYVRS